MKGSIQLPVALGVALFEAAGLLFFASVDLAPQPGSQDTWATHRQKILEATSPKARRGNKATAVAARAPEPSPPPEAPVAAKPPEPRAPEPKAPEAKPPEAKVARPAGGRLTLDTNPWTSVFLGKRKLGDTPLVEVPVPAGHQVFQLKNDEKGINTTLELDIRAGRTTVKSADL